MAIGSFGDPAERKRICGVLSWYLVAWFLSFAYHPVVGRACMNIPTAHSADCLALWHKASGPKVIRMSNIRRILVAEKKTRLKFIARS